VACQQQLDRDDPAFDATAAACRTATAPLAAAALLDRCRGLLPSDAGTCGDLPACVVTAATASARAIAGALFGRVRGTTALVDLEADTTTPEHFYDLPFPSDLRLRADRTPDLSGLPFEATAPLAPQLLGLVTQAQRRRDAPGVAVSYFRFDGPLPARSADAVLPAAADAPVLLIDVTRRALFPLVAQALPPDGWVPGNVLAVAPMPGTVLPPGRYATVVRRAFGDAAGRPLGVSTTLLQLRAGGTPFGPRGDAAREVYLPLWDALDAIGVARADVAAATVFTVGDVVAEVAARSEALRTRHPVTIEDLVLDEVHPRFCELRGQVALPQFQRGVAPFDTGGEFALGEDGLPVKQRDEGAPIVVTIPRAPMPVGGFPLVLYLHGTGGLAAQVVDRGKTLAPNGSPTPGEGPAHVVAAHGIATAGAALPLNPERYPGGSGRTYLNFANLAAYPFTFEQGTIEQRLVLDALAALAIDPALLAACSGPSLPPAETVYRLRTDQIGVLGQSMGAQYANLIAAIEPRVAGAVPTGSGGLWGFVLLEALLVDGMDISGVIPGLVGAATPLTHLHPAFNVLEYAWEAGETIVFAPRIGREPLAGHPARSLYLPAAIDDPGFPSTVYTAMALASHVAQAGELLYSPLQTVLATAGLDGLTTYPVAGNVRSTLDVPRTGVVAQYAGDGILDGHHIFAQLDAVKSQYACFFDTLLRGGRAVVPAPQALDAPCPQ
jgi:hypothetical protein